MKVDQIELFEYFKNRHAFAYAHARASASARNTG